MKKCISVFRKTKNNTFRRVVGLCLVSMLLLGICPFSVFATGGSAESGYVFCVPYTSPAIPVDVGETVTLSDYGVMFAADEMIAANEIEWSSDELAVTNGTVTADAKGVYVLTATAGSLTKNVYLVAKNPEDTEWVLHEESFDDISSFEELEEMGYRNIETANGASTAVSDGKLVLSTDLSKTSYNRVLLPSWLGEFGDYKIEASVAVTDSEKNARWGALMFRLQENTETVSDSAPFYQFAFRSGTTADNGVEIAYASSKNGTKYSWGNYRYKGAHTENLYVEGGAEYHTLTVEAYDDYVYSSIDGVSHADGASIPEYDIGQIGFNCCRIVMSIDSVRVTLQTAPVKVSVSDPASDIILPASMVTDINSASELEALETAIENGDTVPAAAVFAVDKNLSVLASDGSVICNAYDAVKALRFSVIPAFSVKDEETVSVLCKFLEVYAEDSFVISDDSDLIKKARELYPLCRGVLDLSANTELTADDLAQIREMTNACGARICILPNALVSKDNVEYLQRLLMTVWVDGGTSPVSAAKAITSGANGILTQDYAFLASCYTEWFVPNTQIRSSGIIAHRGARSLVQENTVEAALLSYELGATAIENDVFLTSDGKVVVLHDENIEKLTNGTGMITQMTYEELSQYMVDVMGTVTPKPIPTLEEYFEAFKGKDVQIIIEVKDSNTDICAAILELVEKYDILDQINVISFNTNILLEMKALCPEISVGYLTSNLESDDALEKILRAVQTYDSTFNPKYGLIDAELIRAAAHRGVAILPWTLNSQALVDTYLLYGTAALTTDYTQYISSYIKRVNTDQTEYVSSSDGVIPVSFSTLTYDGTVTELMKGTLTVVESSEGFSCSYDRGTFTVSGMGTATMMLSASFFTKSGTMYTVCSEPFTVTVDPDYTEQPADTADKWIVGSGAPVDMANVGDMYLDTKTYDIYRYTDDSEGWTLVGNIKGESGTAPTIGENGNWWIGETDTGVKAQGESGTAPAIGENGNWWIGETDTGVKAQGESGTVPTIGENGNWWIGETDTGVKAQGEKGETGAAGADGKDGVNGVDGKDGVNGVDGADGKDGANGIDGKDGASPEAEVAAAQTIAAVAIILSGVLLIGNIVLVAILVIRKKLF